MLQYFQFFPNLYCIAGLDKFLDEQTETIFYLHHIENITFSFSLQCVPAISYDSKVVSSWTSSLTSAV